MESSDSVDSTSPGCWHGEGTARPRSASGAHKVCLRRRVGWAGVRPGPKTYGGGGRGCSSRHPVLPRGQPWPWGADLLQRRAVPRRADPTDRRARRGRASADQLLPGVAVHPDPFGVADRAAHDPLGHPQRSDRNVQRVGAGGVGEDPRGAADRRRVRLRRLQQLAGGRRTRAVGGRPRHCGVLWAAAQLRRGAVAHRPLVRPRPPTC